MNTRTYASGYQARTSIESFHAHLRLPSPYSQHDGVMPTVGAVWCQTATANTALATQSGEAAPAATACTPRPVQQ